MTSLRFALSMRGCWIWIAGSRVHPESGQQQGCGSKTNTMPNRASLLYNNHVLGRDSSVWARRSGARMGAGIGMVRIHQIASSSNFTWCAFVWCHSRVPISTISFFSVAIKPKHPRFMRQSSLSDRGNWRQDVRHSFPTISKDCVKKFMIQTWELSETISIY